MPAFDHMLVDQREMLQCRRICHDEAIDREALKQSFNRCWRFPCQGGQAPGASYGTAERLLGVPLGKDSYDNPGRSRPGLMRKEVRHG